MLSYHNDIEVKNKYIARFEAHRKADEVIQGTGFSNGRGCFVGCTLDEYNHARFPDELGWPIWLAHLADNIFEGLPPAEAPQFGSDLLLSVPVGVDLDKLKHQLTILRMDRLLELNSKSEYSACKEIDSAIMLVKNCAEAELQGISRDWSAAWSAAWSEAEAAKSAARSAAESARSAELAVRSAESARSASAAWSEAEAARSEVWSEAWSEAEAASSAASAARSAAESARSASSAASAARSAAESAASAARSAAEAARSAAWSKAESAARSEAWSATWSAALAESAESTARPEAYRQERDDLLACLKGLAQKNLVTEKVKAKSNKPT